MKILLDINHPAYFHFFREFILRAREEGHRLLITSRDKDCLIDLFRAYDIPYINKGRGQSSLAGKFFHLFREVLFLYRKAKTFQPDLFLSFASPYAAIVGKLLRKKVITFDDTEPDPLLHRIYPRFSDLILTPSCFEKELGPRHLRFNGYKEAAYMPRTERHPGIRSGLGIPEEGPLVLVRFVSHGATHELGQKGISLKQKIQAVEEFSKYAHVRISSEGNLPEELKSYGFHCPPDQMHALMAECALLYGESTTMAAEAAHLDLPSVVVEEKGRGYLRDLQKKYGIVHWYKEGQQEEALHTALSILKKERTFPDNISQRILAEATDTTRLLLWIMDYFPCSIQLLLDHPGKIGEFRNG